ncbi:hypothetical protein EMIHUDRAFT_226803 [Emiliania huxleyi CCMP1516]|uniref:Phosphatidic acid phosphatase type 2/haloperoxidase domain-containing protein n=2 Tax=Emiliania huxleyi TaxID=2903 RepID=A0A0D3KKA9_EMIH1|nr:hypothetical protein EMIHUDRAFT_226803 [Emiliania huxleyi CCMP1516]EOD36194.1 hypothetical protein EMIHUDRAFT_226803 [Emiliania huxleyi CCMP1516]|eukprot:XP_005788623.1 hypothetical protein EMIHUDRAFT_226803 [Emiliania huxleyi CCMP1516]
MPDWASLSRFEIRHVTLPLQRYRALDVPSQVLGHSVSGEAMLPLFASLYWCLDQHKCFCGIWLVPLSEMANGVVKWLTRRGRPAWVDERVVMHQWSSEFSFPSSHSQLAAAVMTWLVLSSAHAEAATSTPALPSAAYALLVAASRVHVGLHFPSDVAVGLLWGALSAAAYAHIGRELDPRGVPHGNYMGMLGVLAGLAVGGAFKHLFPLHYPGSGASAFVRAVVGNGGCAAAPRRSPLRHAQDASSTRPAGGLLALFEGIGAATPRQPLRLYAALRFLKYWLVPVYILLLAPYAFVRLGL